MDAVEFTAMVQAHGNAIWGFIFRRATGLDAGVSAVEDIEAEVWETAWAKRDSSPIEQELQLPWLYAIARNHVANHLRKTLNRRNKVAVLFRSEPIASAESIILAETELQDLFNLLSAGEKEVMALTIFEELQPSEIAQILKITPNAVSIRIFKARQKISESLERTAEL